MPIPITPVTFIVLVIFSVYLMATGKLKKEYLPSVIQKPLDIIFPGPKRTWREFINENLQKALTFLIKYPQYLIFLFLIFIFRKQLIKIITNDQYRENLISDSFHTINRQQAIIQEMVKNHYHLFERWWKIFYQKSKEISFKDSDRIFNLEKIISQEAEKASQKKLEPWVRLIRESKRNPKDPTVFTIKLKDESMMKRLNRLWGLDNIF